jgi:spectrin beta
VYALFLSQFFADADDVDTWMLDTLRLVSSEDVGRDEASVQSLLKKHRNISDELENYSTVIQALHEQAANLGEGVSKFRRESVWHHIYYLATI